jgi:hypothetical protein
MKWSMMLGSGFLALSLGSGALLAEETATGDVTTQTEQTRTRTEAQQRLNLQVDGEQLREQVRERKESGSGEGEQARVQTRERKEGGSGEQRKHQYQGSTAARSGSGGGRR